MKTRIKFLGAMLVATALMFTSCEKEEEYLNTEETTNVDGTTDGTITDGTNTTDGTTVDSNNVDGTTGGNNEPSQDKVVLDGTLEKIDGHFGIHKDGRFHIIVGDANRLYDYLGHCVEVECFRFFDIAPNATEVAGASDEKFDMIEIIKCDGGAIEPGNTNGGNNGPINEDRVKLDGVLEKIDGHFGIYKDNRFHIIVGDVDRLYNFLGRCVEVDCIRFFDASAGATGAAGTSDEKFEMIEIFDCYDPSITPGGNQGTTSGNTNPNGGPTSGNHTECVLEGELVDHNGVLGIYKGGVFHAIIIGSNDTLDHLRGKVVKVVGYLLYGNANEPMCEMIDIYEL